MIRSHIPRIPKNGRPRSGGPDHLPLHKVLWKLLWQQCWMIFLKELAMLQPAAQPASGSLVAMDNDQARSIKTQSRGRPRSEESEEAILAATLDLLTEKPLRDISMEEIARKAGVGKATIYKWWPSKAYVALDAFLRKTNRMVPTPDTGSVKGDLLEQIRSLLVFYRSPAGRILGQFVAESQMDKEFASLFREQFLKPRREANKVIFDRGVERGEIDANLNRELVLDLIFGSAIYRMIVRHAPLEDKLADDMASILFGGLGNRHSERTGIAGKTARKRSVSDGKAKRQHIQKHQ
jgi:AcrR family transcriptional regulator